VPKRAKCGVDELSVLVGKMLMRYVAVYIASTQNESGREAWNSRERTTLLMERMIRSALPFWEEVYGHDMRRRTPWVRKNVWELELSNSRPLSH